MSSERRSWRRSKRPVALALGRRPGVEGGERGRSEETVGGVATEAPSTDVHGSSSFHGAAVSSIIAGFCFSLGMAVRGRDVVPDPDPNCPPNDANVLKAPVAPMVMALRPYEAVMGMMVTGRRRSLVNPARTFRFTWAGLDEARKVGSEMASADAV